MNWRNPKKDLPKDRQMVWIMLSPHKDRGGLLKSAPSIEIVCGEFYSDDNRVENYDELGMGAIEWQLGGKIDYSRGFEPAIAWLPVEEMVYPEWKD